MTERAALLQTIIQSPDDDAPRLVFADWLEDHDESERAELIRLQCSLASLSPGAPEAEAIQERVNRLLDTRLDHFLSPLTEVGLRFGDEKLNASSTRYHLEAVFRRGFVEEMLVRGSDNFRRFAEHAEAVFRLTPFQHLVVTDVSGAFETDDQGFPTGFWAEVADYVDAEDWRALVQCPDIARLRTLRLRVDLGAAEAAALAASPFLTTRTTLILESGWHDWRQRQSTRPGRVHEGSREEIERILRDRFGDCVRWGG